MRSESTDVLETAMPESTETIGGVSDGPSLRDEFKAFFSDLHEVLNSFRRLFRSKQTIPVDLRDLLLYQACVDVLRQSEGRDGIQSAQAESQIEIIKRVVEYSEKLPSGGALVMYPREMNVESAGLVLASVSRRPEANRIVEEFEHFLVEQFDIEFPVKNLSAKLEPVHLPALVEPLGGTRVQLFPQDLKWKWSVTPKAAGSLGLDLWLQRIEEVEDLNKLGYLFSDYFSPIRVVVPVGEQRRNLTEILFSWLANRAFWITVLSGVASSVIAMYAAFYFGPHNS